MKCGVVQLQPQREGVGEPARLRHLIGRQRTRGHRHADMLARCGGRIGGEGELDLRLLRDGARRAAKDRLEPVKRGFVRQRSSPADDAFGQVLAEDALIIFRHQRTLILVTLVEE